MVPTQYLEAIMPGYIKVVRYFRDVDRGAVAPQSRRLLRRGSSHGRLTWPELIDTEANRAVVLLAPSGAGKTTEMREVASDRRAAGNHAVFVEARVCVAEGLARAAGDDQREGAALDTWRRASGSGVLFVDAVDELALDGKRLRDLMRQLRADLPNVGATSMKIVLSARTGTWSADDSALVHGELERLRTGEDVAAARVVAFEPVDDPAALRALAGGKGVRQIDAFLEAFEAEEVGDLLELRPCDVDLLVEAWNNDGRLGQWLRVLRSHVDASFAETNAARIRTRVMTIAEGRAGLERLAATTILTKRLHVALPNAPTAPVGDAISSRRVYVDWPLGKLADLFENPLLLPKGVDAVQLPQGPITDHLAAEWCASRVNAGLSSNRLRDSLLVRVFDEARFRIPDSRRSVIGWVSAAVPSLRSVLAADFPEVVLFEGDPDALSDGEITDCLRRVVDAMLAGTLSVSPTRGTLAKLARSGLEELTLELLEASADEPDAQMLLLRWAREGRYATLVDAGSALALTQTADSSVRTAAVEFVGLFGSAESRKALLDLTSAQGDGMRAALLNALVPEHLTGAALTNFISTGGSFVLASATSRAARSLSVVDLAECVTTLHRALEGPLIAERSEDQFRVLVPLAIEQLRRVKHLNDATADAVLPVLLLIDRLAGAFYFPTEAGVALTEGIDTIVGLHQRLWLTRLRESHAAAKAYEYMGSVPFASLRGPDLSWLHGLLHDSAQYDHTVLIMILERTYSAMNETSRTAFKASCDAALARYLGDIDAAGFQLKGRREAHEREVAEEQRAEREREVAWFQERATGIRDGSDFHGLFGGYTLLEGSPTSFTKTNSSSLVARIGTDLAADVVQGLRRAWRNLPVELPNPDENGTPNGALIGLTGISLDVTAGLSLSSLSETEANLATRYACHEINRFPAWLQDLAESHGPAVTRTLLEVVDREWESEHGFTRILWAIAEEAPHVLTPIRGIVAERLRQGPPRSEPTTTGAISLLLRPGPPIPELGPLFAREVERNRTSSPEALVRWLRGWSHVAPADAAQWCEDYLASTPQVGPTTIIALANKIADDFDPNLDRQISSLLLSPAGLERWARLMLRALPLSGDEPTPSGRVFTPTARHHAQRFRSACFGRLVKNPCLEARLALKRLVEDAEVARELDSTVRARLLESQLQNAAEAAATPWSEEDVVRFEQADERKPRNLAEFFSQVRSHVVDVAHLLENDDFSYRTLLQRRGGTTPAEREVQLWAASCLRNRAGSLYSVIRENVVDDDKEVDISCFAPGVGQIPIEIKPLGDYSANALVKVVEDQLIGRYMQPPDRQYGVLLLVRTSKTVWKIGDRPDCALADLHNHLSAEATSIATRHGKVVVVEVIDALELPAARNNTR
jgi:hypothetical protein